jgi:signal transduction histidine kinase
MNAPRSAEAARQLQRTSVRELGKKGVERLGQTIAQHRREIERRWLQQVQADVARKPGVALTQLRDGMPDYLLALVDLFQRSDGQTVDLRAQEAWARVAREHGITRVRLGFDIGQLVHEFVVLRHVIRDVAGERGTRMDSAEALLADVLDAAINAAVQAYVEARDYEARRQQAESVAFLTHELRNPLSTAMLAAGRLSSRIPPDLGRTMAILERRHLRLGELIDGVLLTEKLEAGKMETHPRTVGLGELLEGALEAARSVAEQKGLVVRVRYDADREVLLDPVLTRSAIQNIIDNAVKYTDAGEVEVTADVRAGRLVVHVRDTCPGLSPEELRTIFEPFRRGATHKPGTGLGLAIARRAVEVQGGMVAAESPGPTGCHFSVTLPVVGRADRKRPRRRGS